MITFVLLMSASMLTYLFISWTMPITYKAAQSEVLSADAEALAAALNQHTLEESAQLLEEFSQRHSVEAVSYTHLDVYKRQAVNCEHSIKFDSTNLLPRY